MKITRKHRNAIKVYMAGPLFDIADRRHNILLAEKLRQFGYTVILPQEEGLRFFNNGKFDLKGIREDCANQAKTCDVIVANIDGPDADSGTALEVGIAYGSKIALGSGRDFKALLIICVRTDFRTALDREVGINGMFGLADHVIYKPAFVKSLKECQQFYRELSREIDEKIRAWLSVL